MSFTLEMSAETRVGHVFAWTFRYFCQFKKNWCFDNF